MPGLRSIEEVNLKIDEIGMFFRDYDEEYHAKKLGPYTMFKNEDLEDCVRPLNLHDIDTSLTNLKNDPHKHIFMTRRGKDDVVVHLDPVEDKKVRLDLIRFLEDDKG